LKVRTFTGVHVEGEMRKRTEALLNPFRPQKQAAEKATEKGSKAQNEAHVEREAEYEGGEYSEEDGAERRGDIALV